MSIISWELLGCPLRGRIMEEHEEGLQNHILLEVAGMFAIGEPGWADKHDEYLAETYIENHANDE